MGSKQSQPIEDKEKRVKQKKRYDAALLYQYGYKHSKLAKTLHIPYRTVCDYIRRYGNGGIKGLRIIKRTGVREKLTEDQKQGFLNIVSTKRPEDAEIGIFANWTSPLAYPSAEKRYGVS